MRGASPANPWLVRFRANPAATLRLICFHHAGGGASAYRPWLNELPAGIELCAVQLPGREARLREAPFTRLSDLVPVATEAIQPVLDLPFVLFGHSLGAMVAFEVARALAQRGGPQPARLVLSGRRAPTRPERGPRVSHLPTPEFLDEVQRRWDGIPAAVLEEPELLELLLPTLRADLSIVESYVHVPGPPLECPLSCFGGADDPSVDAADLAAWRDHTGSAFSLRMFPGSHFFVQTARAEVLAALWQDVRPLLEHAGARA